MSEVDVQLYQIAYSEAVLAQIEPGYRVLDHRANERSDWYEYSPIRRFLQHEVLDEQAFYGFFSPKFGSKTGLRHADVVRFVRESAPECDVALFSPQPDMAAFFLNVYEQGETFDPGFIDVVSAWLTQIGRPTALRQLVMDSRQIVFSNYFVARPAFWRAWLDLNETLYALCEGAPGPLRDALTAPTTYPGSAQRKVFVMERSASLLLAVDARWRSRAANPFRMAWSGSRLNQFRPQAAMSDALKMAHRDFGFPCYLRAFAQLREQHLQRPEGRAA